MRAFLSVGREHPARTRRAPKVGRRRRAPAPAEGRRKSPPARKGDRNEALTASARRAGTGGGVTAEERQTTTKQRAKLTEQKQLELAAGVALVALQLLLNLLVDALLLARLFAQTARHGEYEWDGVGRPTLGSVRTRSGRPPDLLAATSAASIGDSRRPSLSRPPRLRVVRQQHYSTGTLGPTTIATASQRRHRRRLPTAECDGQHSATASEDDVSMRGRRPDQLFNCATRPKRLAHNIAVVLIYSIVIMSSNQRPSSAGGVGHVTYGTYTLFPDVPGRFPAVQTRADFLSA